MNELWLENVEFLLFFSDILVYLLENLYVHCELARIK